MTCIFSPQIIKEQVHNEFRAAFDELERASGKEKEAAAARLNRAVRRSYNFVGYGKVPEELQPPRGPAYS
jgi:hypothetical protein